MPQKLTCFVASSIPHDNQKKWLKLVNAIGLWEYTKEVAPAFNCRLHSILNLGTITFSRHQSKKKRLVLFLYGKNTYWFSCWGKLSHYQEDWEVEDVSRVMSSWYLLDLNLSWLETATSSPPMLIGFGMESLLFRHDFIYKRINNDSPEPLTSKYFISDAKKSVSRKPEPKPLEIRVFLQPEKMER